MAVMEASMCTDGINTAKDQRSCDTLFSNTCETKTKKVPFCQPCPTCLCLLCLFAEKDVVKSPCALETSFN